MMICDGKDLLDPVDESASVILQDLTEGRTEPLGRSLPLYRGKGIEMENRWTNKMVDGLAKQLMG